VCRKVTVHVIGQTSIKYPLEVIILCSWT